MKIIKWEAVGQKLVKFKTTDFEFRKIRIKNTVFYGVYHKIRCFTNYLENRIATRGHSHSISPGKHYIHYNSKVPKNANSASGSAKKGANVCLIIALCGTLLNTKKFSLVVEAVAQKRKRLPQSFITQGEHRHKTGRRTLYNALQSVLRPR